MCVLQSRFGRKQTPPLSGEVKLWQNLAIFSQADCHTIWPDRKPAAVQILSGLVFWEVVVVRGGGWLQQNVFTPQEGLQVEYVPHFGGKLVIDLACVCTAKSSCFIRTAYEKQNASFFHRSVILTKGTNGLIQKERMVLENLVVHDEVLVSANWTRVVCRQVSRSLKQSKEKSRDSVDGLPTAETLRVHRKNLTTQFNLVFSGGRWPLKFRR